MFKLGPHERVKLDDTKPAKKSDSSDSSDDSSDSDSDDDNDTKDCTSYRKCRFCYKLENKCSANIKCYWDKDKKNCNNNGIVNLQNKRIQLSTKENNKRRRKVIEGAEHQLQKDQLPDPLDSSIINSRRDRKMAVRISDDDAYQKAFSCVFFHIFFFLK